MAGSLVNWHSACRYQFGVAVLAEPAESATDGRRLRSERSRTAIIEAALELIREGTLVPTAQQISDRAGVGMRTFFRHFDDMETMFAAVDKHTRASFAELFETADRSGSLDERIQNLAAHRAKAFEQLSPIALSTHAQLWRSKELEKNYARDQRRLRRELALWLPELEALPRDVQEGVDAATSFETWHRLRAHQALSVKAAIAVVAQLVASLIAAA